MSTAVKIGLLRMVPVFGTAALAIYVEPDMTVVAIASSVGFMAGYFTRVRDSIKGK